MSEKARRITKSFVIEEDIFRALEYEAEREGTSVNALLNSVLGKWAIFYRFTEREGCSVIVSHTGDFIMDEISEEKWTEEYKNIMLNTIPAMMLEANLKMDLTTVVKVVFEKALLYANAYQGFNYFVDDEGYLTLVFRHKRDIKNSRVMGNAFSVFIQEKLNLPNTLQVSKYNVIIKILARNLPELDMLMAIR